MEKGRKIEFCLDFPFQTLAEWGGSASVFEKRSLMIPFYHKLRNYFKGVAAETGQPPRY